MARQHLDGMAVVAFAFLAFMILNLVRDRQGERPASKLPSASFVNRAASRSTPPASSGQLPAQATAQADADAIRLPYDDYVLTQGPHGFDYGQMAIDITAGKGATIMSPINGVVTALYIDDLGNTTLIIDNDHYQITMLHGVFTVTVGERLDIGQPVGQESNQGNTVDGLGRSCRGRDCGYHLHLNVYDKYLGANVNPLELFHIQ